MNNLAVIPLLPDLVADPESLAWDRIFGGLNVGYTVRGGALPQASTAKVFWASGTNASDRSATAIWTQDIPNGAQEGLADIYRLPR